MPPVKRKKKVVEGHHKPIDNENACIFCGRTDDDPDKFGKFLEKGDIKVHNFCMLFASGLSQNGEDDDDGIQGFLEKDIHREVRRGKKMTCRFCEQPGATVGCTVKSCKIVFHWPCGLERHVLSQHFGSFQSFCFEHRPRQPVLKKSGRGSPCPECPICFCEVANRPTLHTLQGPCCTKAWYHRDCVQRQARSAGLHFFRCPLCNDQEKFPQEMLTHGIFIPDQDAAWETEPNAFEELLERYERCDAENCPCPEGRTYNVPSEGWNLLVCCVCSSTGAHATCAGLKTRNPDHSWTCKDCFKVVRGKCKRPKHTLVHCKQFTPYSPRNEYPLKRGLKRRRVSSWARGNVKKRVCVKFSPWKRYKTIPLNGKWGDCGSSPRSSINCTERCSAGVHRPRIPKLRLDRLDATIEGGRRLNGGVSVPSCSTPRKTSLTSVGGAKWSPVMPSTSAPRENVVEVDYALMLASSDRSDDSSSPDSDVRNAAMKLCIVGNSSDDSDHTVTKVKEEKCTDDRCSDSHNDASKKMWNISYKKIPNPNERRKYNRKPKSVGAGQKTLFNFFTPIPKTAEREEEKRKPVLSVKPTTRIRHNSSSDDEISFRDCRDKCLEFAETSDCESMIPLTVEKTDRSRLENPHSKNLRKSLPKTTAQTPAPGTSKHFPSTSKSELESLIIIDSESDSVSSVAGKDNDKYPSTKVPGVGPKVLIHVISSDSTSQSDSTSTSSEIEELDLPSRDSWSKTLSERQLKTRDSDTSSSSSRRSGLFNLKNLPLDSQSGDDGLFNLKAVPGLDKINCSISDQENSAPCFSPMAGRRKRLRSKRRKCELVRSSSSSSESLSRDQCRSRDQGGSRPVGIVQPLSSGSESQSGPHLRQILIPPSSVNQSDCAALDQ